MFTEVSQSINISVFYDTSNENIFVKRYLAHEIKFSTANKGVKCLIFDGIDVSFKWLK